MFCPKCGTKNPDDGKFCRKCGKVLGNDSNAMTGLSGKHGSKAERKKNYSWESAFGKLFMGLAFIAVAAILGYTGAAGGKTWWFWMLIPAFGMIGSGFAQIIHIRSVSAAGPVESVGQQSIGVNSVRELPENQTEYVSSIPENKYATGELVPPSVVENTTRHLELDKEGKTMTLPKDGPEN